MNTWRVLRALVRKEFIEVVRDPITLAVAVLLPLLLLFIFGYGLSMDVEDVPIAVYDQDRTQDSQRFVEAFVQSGYFRLHRNLMSPREVDAALDRGEATVVILIPPDFSRTLGSDREASVQLLIDGSFSPTALIVSNYLAAVVNRFSSGLAERRLAELGLDAPPPLRLESRVWYNAPMKTVNYIVPGLFAVLLMAFPPMLTALAIVRERERGTIEQIYVSPVSPALFILGKILPYAAIAFAEMLLVLVVGTYWFDIPLRGSLALLLGASLLYVFVTVGLGVAVSTVARTQVAAVFLSLVGTLMPSFLFSGFLFPIATMPYVMQLYTYVFPTRYFNDISRDLFLKGVGIEYLWGNLALLGLYAIVLFGAASLSLRKKVAR
ncbi:ABC transporter permease [Aromatoleum toluclasticum]|uniref:ABC transporter permease n=1 Tax=Aromatoleum toluclasticum TaxID=92003 RepID=UPI00036B303B|nr:ABC transporter permease [Aromatoleum toluclasticum]